MLTNNANENEKIFSFIFVRVDDKTAFDVIGNVC